MSWLKDASPLMHSKAGLYDGSLVSGSGSGSVPSETQMGGLVPISDPSS